MIGHAKKQENKTRKEGELNWHWPRNYTNDIIYTSEHSNSYYNYYQYIQEIIGQNEHVK